MKIELRRYDQCNDYMECYKHNFRQVDNIQNDAFFNEFIIRLSEWSGIAYEIVLTDCKDYIIQRSEYFPDMLKPDIRNELAFPYLIGEFIRRLGARKYKTAEVIVDVWYPNAIEIFYTNELERGLSENSRCLSVPFDSLIYIRPRHFFAAVVPFMCCLGACHSVCVAHGLDLRKYLCNFFLRVLVGFTLKETVRPRVVISGHDNGISYLTIKAAGAECVLLQNGRRMVYSNFAFKYADYYFCFGEILQMMKLGFAHHVFKNIYNFGSIRLYGHRKHRAQDSSLVYDILWVSTMVPVYDEKSCRLWKYWEHPEVPAETIKMFNDFARNSRLRIAFHCRFAEEIGMLEKAGLKSDHIKYISSDQQDVLTSVDQSMVVLSPMSTACPEAMGMGKKVGFVRMSTNNYPNLLYADLGVEFNLKSTETLEKFIMRLMERELNYKDYFVQNWNYVGDLLEIVKNILGKNGLRGEIA